MFQYKKWIVGLIGFCFCFPSFGKIEGVATKVSLLQQLQSSLKISIQRMKIPDAIVGKFPVTNEIQEIKPSFLASWTQATYLACTQAIRSGTVPVLKDEMEIKTWLGEFARRAWGKQPSETEVGEIYQSSYEDNKQLSSTLKANISCSMVLSSPRVYMIFRAGKGL